MYFTTISAAAVAALAFLATPVVGAAMPASDDTDQLEARGALLVCQFGGVQACSIECVGLGYSHGGHCSSTETCICNPSNGPSTTRRA
ncbi:hypothetical protein XPA_010127 [Xanthoria parietina]